MSEACYDVSAAVLDREGKTKNPPTSGDADGFSCSCSPTRAKPKLGRFGSGLMLIFQRCRPVPLAFAARSGSARDRTISATIDGVSR
jgi:hypothetical protein